MDVRLPDGTVIKDVPDGTTKADLAAKLQKNGMEVPAEWMTPADKPKGAPMSRMEKIGTGMADPIHGGAQLLTKMLPTGVVDAGNSLNNWLAEKTGMFPKLQERNLSSLVTGGPTGVDKLVRDRETEYQANRVAAGESGIDGYRLLGNVASPANLAIAARAPTALSLGGRVLTGSALGAGSAALNPVTEGEGFASEKGKQIGLGAAFGGAVSAVTGAIGRAISPKASVNPELALLKDAGVKPTIGQSLGGRWNALEEKLQSLPIMGDAIALARKKSLEGFNSAAINRATGPVGAKVEGTGSAAVAEAGDLLGKAYDDALGSLKVVKFDQQFATDAKQLKGMAQNLLPEMRKKFNNTLSNVVGERTSQAGGMTAETFKKAESEIGKLAASYRSSGTASERELGDALTQLQALMKAQVGRNSPEAAAALKAADEGWANLVRVEGASKAAMNTDGLFTPGQLNQSIRTADKSVRKRAVSRGEALMQDLGSAGQNVLGNKVPNSFTADRAMLGLGALGSGALSPAIPAGLLSGAALYSPQAQGLLRLLVSERPELAGPIAEALRKASPALIPAGAQVGLELAK